MLTSQLSSVIAHMACAERKFHHRPRRCLGLFSAFTAALIFTVGSFLRGPRASSKIQRRFHLQKRYARYPVQVSVDWTMRASCLLFNGYAHCMLSGTSHSSVRDEDILVSSEHFPSANER